MLLNQNQAQQKTETSRGMKYLFLTFQTQRCEPLINEKQMKWQLTFFSLNQSEILRSTDWRQGPEFFLNFQ